MRLFDRFYSERDLPAPSELLMQHTPKGATWGEHTPMTNYPSDDILKLSAAQLFWEVSFLNRRQVGDSWAACLSRLHTCTPESGQFRAQLLSPAAGQS